MINQSQNKEVMTSSGIDQVIPNSKSTAAEVIASFSFLETHQQVIEPTSQPISLEMAVILRRGQVQISLRQVQEDLTIETFLILTVQMI